MKILLKPYVALATRWRTDEFFRARLQLALLYVIITAVVLGLFSGFLLVRVEQQWQELRLHNISEALISSEQAIEIAKAEFPDAAVTDIDEEFLRGQLVYVVETRNEGHEVDLYIHPSSGELLATNDAYEEPETMNDLFINDFEENLLVANLIILIFVALFGYVFAGYTLRPIKRKLEQQEQFSTDVAHEIRTPLSAMIAVTDAVLRRDESVAAYKEALGRFNTEAKRLSMLSEDLLLSTTGDRDVVLSPVSLELVLRTVQERLGSLAIDRGVAITVHTTKPATIDGNQLLLERLFENILHNAIKFSRDGGTIDITIDGKTVSIADTGIGMSAETKAKLFDRFYTAGTARDERGGHGAGLGMSIVRELAGFHDATLSVESELDAGTKITVTFLQ